MPDFFLGKSIADNHRREQEIVKFAKDGEFEKFSDLIGKFSSSSQDKYTITLNKESFEKGVGEGFTDLKYKEERVYSEPTTALGQLIANSLESSRMISDKSIPIYNSDVFKMIKLVKSMLSSNLVNGRAGENLAYNTIEVWIKFTSILPFGDNVDSLREQLLDSKYDDSLATYFNTLKYNLPKEFKHLENLMSNEFLKNIDPGVLENDGRVNTIESRNNDSAIDRKVLKDSFVELIKKNI